MSGKLDATVWFGKSLAVVTTDTVDTVPCGRGLRVGVGKVNIRSFDVTGVLAMTASAARLLPGWILSCCLLPTCTAWGQSPPPGYFAGPPPGYGPAYAEPGPGMPAPLVEPWQGGVYGAGRASVDSAQSLAFPDTALERTIKNVFRHNYFRVEYLNWDVSDPRAGFLGADGLITFADARSALIERFPGTTPSFFDEQQLQSGVIRTPLTGNLAGDASIVQSSGLAGYYRDALSRSVVRAYDARQSPLSNANLAASDFLRGRLATTDDALINSNNGIRGTWGIVGDDNVIEISAFALQSSSNRLPIRVGIASELLPTPVPTADDPFTVDIDEPTVGQSLAVHQLVNVTTIRTAGPASVAAVPQGTVRSTTSGPKAVVFTASGTPGTATVPSRNVFPFQEALVYRGLYQADWKTSVWGSEANWLADSLNPNDPLQWRPSLGMRYVSFKESLNQAGLRRELTSSEASGASSIPASDLTTIDSLTFNNYYGPQVGLRGELTHPWFTFSVEPKWMLGVNTAKAELDARNIVPSTVAGATPDRVYQTENSTTFGPIFDLALNGRVNLNSHMRLTVGYNFMWLGSLTRPDSNIYYGVLDRQTVTVTNPGDPSTDVFVSSQRTNDFRLQTKWQDAVIQGISGGIEVTY